MANVNFASGGQAPYRQFIAWFDFGGGAIPSGVSSYSNDIPQVGKITLDVSNSGNQTQTQFGGAGGDLFGIAYTGVGGNPSIYIFQPSGGNLRGSITVQNIKIVDLNNNPINYFLITGDSETTVISNEFITWTTNGSAWTNFGFYSSGGAPYASSFSGIGTQSVTSTMNNPGGPSVSPALSSQNATQLTIAAEPHGGEGAGVGFLLSYATLTKYVDKLYSGLNDTITYTFVVTNKSISNINGTITDNLSSYVTFIPNSVLINGSISTTQPPNLSIGNINSGDVVTVQFKVKVTSLPPNNNILNSGTFSGSGSSGTLNATSNNVSTTISYLANTIAKYVNTTLVAISQSITYTIAVKNTGNIPMPSPVILDTIPNGTSYIQNSLTNATGSPNSTIFLDTIPPGLTSTITFKVLVVSVPCPNPIPNNATVFYSYKIDPTSQTTLSGGGVSNTVETLVGFADLSSKKYVDVGYSYLGDTITYTVSLFNSGVGPAKNITFFDTLPYISSFVPDSVMINGMNEPGASIGPSGLNIPLLNSNEILTITFMVISNTLPTINPINNSGYFTYLDDTPNTVKNTFTNNVSTTITLLTSILSKYVDKSIVPLYDTITYTITTKNTGNIDMLTPIIYDTLPNGVEYIAGSLINATGSPNTSILLPTISPSTSITISFKVKIVTIPSPNPILNNVSLLYSYKVDPNSTTTFTSSNTSNLVSTLVGFSDITSKKYVDSNYAILNDTLTYTISITNKGAGAARTVQFFDTLPSQLTLIPNTFLVNGILNQSINSNPIISPLKNILANETVTILFKVFVNTLPYTNPISNISSFTFTDDTPNITKNSVTNIVSTTVLMAILDSQKSVTPSFSNINSTITYSITISNSGNNQATNVLLFDTLPNFAILIPNSLSQDGQSFPIIDESFYALLPNPIPPSTSSTVTFSIFVNTLPTPNPLINNAFIYYNYTSNPSFLNGKSSSTFTNNVSTLILKASIDIIKSRDKEYADCFDTITYTIVYKNTGNTTAINIFFKDTIPDGTILINNSMYLDGLLLPPVSPELGLNIPFIGAGKSSTITFQVKVIC